MHVGNLTFLRKNLRNTYDTTAEIFNDVKDIKAMLGTIVPLVQGNYVTLIILHNFFFNKK